MLTAPAILELPQPALEEPMGIVISRGSRESAPPVFTAYEWGPAPELDDEREEHRAV